MPTESELLRYASHVVAVCPKCGAVYPDFMRGQVQSSIRKIFGMKYCAVICHGCKKIVGWEKP